MRFDGLSFEPAFFVHLLRGMNLKMGIMKWKLRLVVLMFLLGGSVVSRSQLSYSFDYVTGTLHISGSGSEVDPMEVNKALGRLYSFVLDETLKAIDFSKVTTLKSIGKYAFSNCVGLAQVPVFPPSLETIEDGAFSGCRNMSGILQLPQSVSSIGSYAFFECAGLSGTLVFPAALTTLDVFAFQKCTGVISADYSQCLSLTDTGAGTFSGCTGLTSVTFPPLLMSIGDVSFSYCSGLHSLSFPESLVSIGKSAFGLCSGLSATLIFPASLEIIDESAFSGCSGITSVDFSACRSFANIGSRAFMTCPGLAGCLKLPASLVTIGEEAFRYCSGLSSIDLADCIHLECIGADMLRESNIVSLDLSKCTSLTTIGDGAFMNSKVLKSVDISGCTSLKTIGDYAFCNCTNLTGKIIFPVSLTTIGEAAFSVCVNLSELLLPASMQTIGKGAFSCCSRLTGSLSLPAGLTVIDAEAFKECTGFTSVDFSQCGRLTSIGNDAFNNCSGLISLDFSDCTSLKTIGGGAFCGCTYLNKLILPPSLTTIGSIAFLGCRYLTGLVLPASLAGIGRSAFSGCSGLTGILTLPASLISVEQYAFSECDGLDALRCLRQVPPAISTNTFKNTKFKFCFVPEGKKNDYRTASGWIQFSGNWAFIDKEEIATVNVAEAGTLGISILQQSGKHPSVVTQLMIKGVLNESDYKYIHTNMPLLYVVDMAEANVVSIPDEAFKGSKILSFQFPSSLTAIGKSAFSHCDGLVSLSFPATLNTIGSTAFGGCDKLDTIFCAANTPPILGNAVFEGVDKETCYLYIPKGTDVLAKYFSALQWGDFINIIQKDYPTSLIPVRDSELKVYGLKSEIVMEGALSPEAYVLSDITGKMVAAGTLAPMSRFNVLVPTGIYILKIAGQCLKVFVR